MCGSVCVHMLTQISRLYLDVCTYTEVCVSSTCTVVIG